jgi:hypothetical protein
MINFLKSCNKKFMLNSLSFNNLYQKKFIGFKRYFFSSELSYTSILFFCSNICNYFSPSLIFVNIYCDRFWICLFTKLFYIDNILKYNNTISNYYSCLDNNIGLEYDYCYFVITVYLIRTLFYFL